MPCVCQHASWVIVGCAVLQCVVLLCLLLIRCATLCHVVLCCAVLCCVVLYCIVSCCVVLCVFCIMFCHTHLTSLLFVCSVVLHVVGHGGWCTELCIALGVIGPV